MAFDGWPCSILIPSWALAVTVIASNTHIQISNYSLNLMKTKSPGICSKAVRLTFSGGIAIGIIIWKLFSWCGGGGYCFWRYMYGSKKVFKHCSRMDSQNSLSHQPWYLQVNTSQNMLSQHWSCKKALKKFPNSNKFEKCHLLYTPFKNSIAKTWKQPKCPKINEWIKKMWYIYTMEYYSAIKRNEIGHL